MRRAAKREEYEQQRCAGRLHDCWFKPRQARFSSVRWLPATARGLSGRKGTRGAKGLCQRVNTGLRCTNESRLESPPSADQRQRQAEVRAGKLDSVGDGPCSLPSCGGKMKKRRRREGFPHRELFRRWISTRLGFPAGRGGRPPLGARRR